MLISTRSVTTLLICSLSGSAPPLRAQTAAGASPDVPMCYLVVVRPDSAIRWRIEDAAMRRLAGDSSAKPSAELLSRSVPAETTFLRLDTSTSIAQGSSPRWKATTYAKTPPPLQRQRDQSEDGFWTIRTDSLEVQLWGASGSWREWFGGPDTGGTMTLGYVAETHRGYEARGTARFTLSACP